MNQEVLGASVYPEFSAARTRLDEVHTKLDQQVSGLVGEVFSIARTTMPIYTASDDNPLRLPSSTDRVGSHSYLIKTVDYNDQTVFLLLHGDPYRMVIVDHYKNQPTVAPDGRVLGEPEQTTYFAKWLRGLAFVAYSLSKDRNPRLYSHDIDFRGKVARGYGCPGRLSLTDMEAINPGVDYITPGLEDSIDPVSNGLAVLDMLKRGSVLTRITHDYSLPNLQVGVFVDP